jgi:hypothetical protein
MNNLFSKKSIIFVGLLGLFCCRQVFTWSFWPAKEETVLEQLERKALAGDAAAQCDLGVAFETGVERQSGEKVGIDLSRAIDLYTKAANQDDMYAQSNIARCYFYGRGVSENIPEAIAWARRAARPEYAEGQYLLASLLVDKGALKEEVGEVLVLLQRASELGHLRATKMLYSLYSTDFSIKKRDVFKSIKNKSKALTLLCKLANMGDLDAQYRIARKFKSSGDSEKAFYWCEKAAQKGSLMAQSQLFFWYCLGDVVDRDFEEAMRWSVLALSNEGAGTRFFGTLAEQLRKGSVHSSVSVREFWKKCLCRYSSFYDCEQQALAGDVPALAFLGAAYWTGVKRDDIEIIEIDLVRALWWSAMAALQGDFLAQYTVSEIASFLGLSKEKREWCLKAAEQGFVEAEFGIWKDRGKERNSSKALDYLFRAAEQGHLAAQLTAANVFLEGKLVECDIAKALHWFERAVLIDETGVLEKIILIYAEGPLGVQDVIKSTELYEKKSHGDSGALAMKIADLYASGWSFVEKNPDKAMAWCLKAIENGRDAGAVYYHIALWYDAEKNKDIEKAFMWYTKAAMEGHAQAQFSLADMYLESFNQPNFEKAFYWCELSAQQNNVNAQFYLGRMYLGGQGVKKDFEKAKFWLQRAADQSDCEACFYCGLMFEQGCLGSKDDVRAQVYFEQAKKMKGYYRYRLKEAREGFLVLLAS